MNKIVTTGPSHAFKRDFSSSYPLISGIVSSDNPACIFNVILVEKKLYLYKTYHSVACVVSACPKEHTTGKSSSYGSCWTGRGKLSGYSNALVTFTSTKPRNSAIMLFF